MNIIQRVALRLAGITAKDLQALHPEAFTRELLYSGNSDQAKDSTPNASNAYEEYSGQAWVYKATSTVARSFRAVPLYVMRGEDWIEGHPVERLLAKPNPAMTGSAMWERWITDVYLAGETGLEVARNKRGEVAELWPRQGRTVTIDAASSRYLKANGYTIKDGAGDPYTLTPEEFIWSRLYNPLSAWRGLGVYQAAALGVGTDKQAQKYAASFFKGMARPDYVVTTPQGVTQTEKDIILAQIEAMTQGKNRGIVMEQGITDIKPLSFAPKDLIWETIRAMTREEIGAVAGVPGELMGDKSATYENRAEAVKSFWNDTLKPLCNWRDEHLTEYFRAIGLIRAEETVESDFSGVEALEQSYNDRLTYATQLTALGVTLRDANEMFDLGIPDASLLASEEEEEPEPEEVPAQPAPQANVDDADEPEEPETPQKALTRAMPWPTYGSDEHKAMLDVWEKAIAPREARMRQALKQLFAEQEKDVMRRVGAGAKTAEDAAKAPFDLAKWIRLFRLRLSPQIRLTLAEAGRDAMNDLNIGVSFDVADPQVLNYMRDRENKIKGVVEKTFDDLKRDISQGIEAGESIDKIAARVQERMGPIADGRATAIARTEVIGASNGGKVLAWKQSGVVTGKRWLASTSHMDANDPNPVRESHVEAHGQEVKIDEDFSVGNGEGKAPGQIANGGDSLPEENINCFPFDTLVDISEDNGITGASRRWYEGALIELVTRTGRKLTGTPNHPVMTARGWVPLQSLDELDRVLSRRDSGESPVVAPDVNHLPAKIGQTFDLCEVMGAFDRAAGADEQFHGDGRRYSEIDVVSVYGELLNRPDPMSGERVLQLNLATPDLAQTARPGAGVSHAPIGGLLAPSDIRISGGGERLPIIGAGVGHAGEHAIATVADGDAMIAEQSLNSGARPDATLGELLDRYPGEVFLDEVISVREVEFSGHVFNLETVDGWYYANAIVSHNCRCTMLAVTDQGRGMKAQPAPQQEAADDMRQPINITVSPIINMPEIKMPDTLRFSDMPAPIVNVAAPVVNVEKQDAPIVNVAAPIVNVAASEQPAPVVNVSAPKATSQTQTVNRDAQGSIISTTTTYKYEGQ